MKNSCINEQLMNKEFSNVNHNFSFDNLFNKYIENSDILKIVDNFKDDTAAGFDRVTIKLLKNSIDLIVNPLAYIYNLSIKQSIFPDYFKVAVVKPLLKGGDCKNISNYRPISLLTSFSKILEKLIKARLITFLEENQLLSYNQFGFRPGLGTEEALYSTTQFIYNELDSGSKVIPSYFFGSS